MVAVTCCARMTRTKHSERGTKREREETGSNSCSLLFRQFFVLLWKNIILQVRRPIGTVFEIIVPIASVAVIIVFRIALFRAEDRCFVTFPSDHLTVPSTGNYTVYYAPNNITQVNPVIQSIQEQLADSGGVLVGVATEQEFIELIRGNGSTNGQIPDSDTRLFGCFLDGAGLYFDRVTGDELEYTIRLRHEVPTANTWRTQRIAPGVDRPGPRVVNAYLNDGFLHLEKIVSEAIVQWRTGNPITVDVSVRQFPHPNYRSDVFLTIVVFLLPLFVILSFLYSAGVLVKELVLEKETRIRETMLMMGLSQWVLWSTWYIKQVLFLLGPAIIITLCLRFGRIFPNSNVLLLFVYILMFVISGIAFCFLVSVFFSSARIGLIAGYMLWFLSYFPQFATANLFDDLSLGAKLAMCTLSNSCVGLGVNVLSILEQREEGLQFNNFGSPLSLDEEFHMGWVILMLLIDSFVYMVLAWYIDAVRPGKYGVPKPFYFPFLPSYWCGGRRRKFRRKPSDLLEHGAGDNNMDSTAHEDEPKDLKVGIAISELTKIYNKRNPKKRKLAVDKLTLNMYKGQITALLGHNGAGKTTTMSILTGLFPPTSGSAQIDGLSVVEDISLIRRNLGICPQHNVLFDRLTVLEHLRFFARLKGLPERLVKESAKLMVEDLQLADKHSTPASELSGGMKRKLSVGIALVGGSEIVILDEPTSGMDPYARRATWDLLSRNKNGRTIVLTTHFMDEADLLGDRIAIMAEGKLKCSGSPLFLKSRYGVGYHMIMVKEPHCNSSVVVNLVTSIVQGSEMVTDVGAEISFVLPSTASHQFPQLFDRLEAEQKSLGISSFGVSVTTMEEVFMRVGQGTDETLETRLDRRTSLKKSPSKHHPPPPPTEPETSFILMNTSAGRLTVQPSPRRPSILDLAEEITENDHQQSPPPAEPTVEVTRNRGHQNFHALNTGVALWFQQFFAMFLKRFYNSIRFIWGVIWQLILPVLFVLLGLILAKTLPGRNSDDPKRLLSLTNSALSNNLTLFWAQLGSGTPSLDLPGGVNGLPTSANYFDLTQPVLDIFNNVQTPSNSSGCCQYRNQILDKFCASQSVSDLENQCSNEELFGYRQCMTCLSCCGARRQRLPTCSNPLQQQPLSSANVASFCPNPPPISTADLSSPTGTLDDRNVYVAEHLLSVSASLRPRAFFLRYQAGFVVHSLSPAYIACGCNSSLGACSTLHIASTDDTSDPSMFFNSSVLQVPGVVSFCNQSLFSALPTFNPLTSCSQPTNFTFNGLLSSCMDTGSCNRSQCRCPGPGSLTDECRVGSNYLPQQPKEHVTVWYNNEGYHMSAAALNGFYNVYLSSKNQNFTIILNNQPLTRNVTSQIDDAQREFLGFTISSMSVFGVSFLIASFIIFLVQEKESKSKHLQFVSGVHSSSYWLATFAWDMVNCLIPIVAIFILFAAFNLTGFQGVNLAAILLLLILVCWSGIPITYCFSFLFSNALVAYSLMVVFFYFGSLILQTILVLVSVDNRDVSDQLHYVFLLHPSYAFGMGISDMYTNEQLRSTCTQSDLFRAQCESGGITFSESSFEFLRPAIGHIFVFMFAEGVIFMALTILIEHGFYLSELKRCFYSRVGTTIDTFEIPGEDDDVTTERSKVAIASPESAVIINNLMKEYTSLCSCKCCCMGACHKPAKLAVNGVNLVIPSGECFGLLGVNGAGKTTTFKILTGDISMTSGTAVIAGYDIRTQLRQVQQRIGYCPQFDALIERLTGRELLTMFARLRGIREKDIKRAVQLELDRLDLVKYASKLCGNYSGGNKRKLSTAVALVGNPTILLLDEPSTGMDPNTRRFLWDALSSVIQEGRSVILTSHSMEECEALCTRLAVMVNGNFKCLGSIQHLKSKFGSGFTLQLKVKPVDGPPVEEAFSRRTFSFRSMSSPSRASTASPTHVSVHSSSHSPYDTAAVQQFVTTTFPGARLLEKHQGSMTYNITGADLTWSKLFLQLEQNKERLNVVDYSVSQTTLEQVFINFAKEQIDAE